MTFFFGVALTLTAVHLRNESHRVVTLSPSQVDNLFLYASLKNGYLEGTFFNQNADIRVTRITVKTVPKDEANPFNKFTPHLFNVISVATPRAMSSQFRVETVLLNPDFHTLRVVEAQGIISQ